MAQVIVYENGNAIGGEGHPTYARDITFENEGTDLEAETTQEAIVEVNEKTKHGIMELWKNSDITQNFAGQTINITDFDSTLYDAVIIAYEETTNEAYGASWREFDKDILSLSGVTFRIDTVALASTNAQYRARTVTFSLSGSTLSLGFGDATIYTYPYSGTGQTTSTNNALLVPVRVLGLIHND